MELQHARQEVLIFTTTSLSQRTLYRKNSSNNDNSAIEELEEAFWSGLLNELIPEIMISTRDTKMVIWGVYAGEFYIHIDMAHSPGIAAPIHSIDPNLHLALKNMN